jgi:hypothetical protein
MTDPFLRLFQLLDAQIQGKISALDTVRKRVTASHSLPSPWQTWLLIGLVRYRRRLRAARRVYKTLVLGLPATATRRQVFKRMEKAPAFGVIPGKPAWEFECDGSQVTLRHRLKKEELALRLHSTSNIDRCSFLYYLESSSRPAERRLSVLHPSTDSLMHTLRDLTEAGVLESEYERDEFRLSPVVLKYEPHLRRFGQAWDTGLLRLPLSILIGDWLAAEEVSQSGTRRLIEQTRDQAERCRRQRAEHLRNILQTTGHNDGDVLVALAELGVADLREHLRQALHSKTDSLWAALEILAREDATELLPEVYRVLVRPDVDAEQLVQAASILLRHGHRQAECVGVLCSAQTDDVLGVALLLLEYDRPRARGYLRQALRSGSAEAAAVLGVLDEPWTREELVKALNESADEKVVGISSTALKESKDPEARAIAETWESSYPDAVEPREGVMSQVEYLMQEYHDDVIRFRKPNQ